MRENMTLELVDSTQMRVKSTLGTPTESTI
jgi:hypothetical protein